MHWSLSIIIISPTLLPGCHFQTDKLSQYIFCKGFHKLLGPFVTFFFRSKQVTGDKRVISGREMSRNYPITMEADSSLTAMLSCLLAL